MVSCPDGPLGGIEVVPAQTIAIIRGKGVMEVVISLTEGEISAVAKNNSTSSSEWQKMIQLPAPSGEK